MKFALISHVLPPGGSGQAMVIYRLLRALDPNDYCLISQQNHGAEAGRRDYFGRLPGRYYHLPPELQVTKDMPRWRRRLNILLGLIFGLPVRAGRIARIIRGEKCEAVVACTGGDMLNLPAGYLASRRVGVPFYAYIFDDYANQLPKLRFFARRLEPLLLKRAAAIITPNEFMRDVLRQRHGVEAIVIRNPCDISDYQASPINEALSSNGEIKIVYTGGVYGAHYDAFRRLVAAIELLNRWNVKLHVYTADPHSELTQEGIRGPVVFHEYQEASTMPRVQQQADLLFLPLAFNSPFPEVIRTSAPGKTGELLAARRPILVHAPPDSFIAWYFRQHECGVVVDESDPAKLAQAIERILSDESLRQRVSAHAWERALSDFSALVAQSRFAKLMKLDILN